MIQTQIEIIIITNMVEKIQKWYLQSATYSIDAAIDAMVE